MKYKAKSNNLEAHLHTEYAQEIGLSNLQLDGQVGLVPIGQVKSLLWWVVGWWVVGGF